MTLWNRNYVSSFIFLGAATVLQMATILVLARELGASEFGRYSLYASSVAIAVEICGLGAGDYFIRHARAGHHSIQVLAGFCATYGICATAVIGPCLAMTLQIFGVIYVSPILALAITAEIMSVRGSLFVEYFYIGAADPVGANVTKMFFNTMRFCSALTFFYLLSIDSDLFGWIIFQSFVSVFSLSVISVIYTRRQKVRFPYMTWSMISESAPFGVTQVLRTAQQNLDRLLLGLVLPLSALGAYSAASRFTMASLIPIVALMRGAVPGFYDNAAFGRRALNRFALRVARTAIILATLAGLLLVVGLFAVEWFLGNEYDNIVAIGISLIPSVYLTVIGYIFGDYFNAIGLARMRMNITIMSMLLYFIMLYSFGMSFGLFGVVVAINISGMVTVILYAGYLFHIGGRVNRP